MDRHLAWTNSKTYRSKSKMPTTKTKTLRISKKSLISVWIKQRKWCWINMTGWLMSLRHTRTREELIAPTKWVAAIAKRHQPWKLMRDEWTSFFTRIVLIVFKTTKVRLLYNKVAILNQLNQVNQKVKMAKKNNQFSQKWTKRILLNSYRTAGENQLLENLTITQCSCHVLVQV